MNTQPKDAEIFMDGSYYKIGLHGLLFRYTVDEWIRSTKDKEEVLKAIEKERNEWTDTK